MGWQEIGEAAGGQLWRCDLIRTGLHRGLQNAEPFAALY